MSLATRCNSCSTVFKVVQDQLKVSKGWVRCGRCDTVFNALEELFELPDDGIAGVPTTTLAATESPPTVSGESDEPARWELPPDPLESLLAEPESVFGRSAHGPRRSGAQQTPAESVKRRDRNEFADAQFDSDLFAPEAGHPLESHTDSTAGQYSPPLPSDDTPAFVRHADRQARWRSPRARVLLSVVAVFLLAGLTLQVGHHFRARLAATVPDIRPALAQWCTWTGCTIESHRSIKDISVEHTALTRLPGRMDAFRLSVTLRNRSDWVLRLPSIDLSVTDVSGQLIARRTLSATDFQVKSDTLPSQTEAPLQLTLQSVNPAINGYTVEIFYP